MTQVDNPVLIHLAPFTGAYGLSFVIVAVNALWLVRLRANGRSYKLPLGAVVVLAIVVSHVLQLRQQKAPNHLGTANSATLVQENLSVGAEAKGVHESPDRLIDSFNELSLYPPVDRCRGSSELPRTDCFQSGSRGGGSPVPTDLIAWPESPSGFRSDDPYFHAGLAALARTANAPLVIGSLGVVPDAMVVRGVRVYNSAIFVSGDGAVEGRYDKIHLVPWGEYVPFRSFFFFAKRLTAGVGDMDRGSKRVVFRADGHTYGVFICYESIFGDEVREFVKSGAEVLVNISDDGWFGDTSAPWQHLNMVRMRAIENHRWILRSTNTGVTAAIDPYGRVTAVAPRHIRTALHTGFNFDRETPFYTIHGDLFAYACAVFTALALVSSSLQWAGATVPS
jgi:apolipoprotein N-acyltransferase